VRCLAEQHDATIADELQEGVLGPRAVVERDDQAVEAVDRGAALM